jgi:AcrR family transcriptional regulator
MRTCQTTKKILLARGVEVAEKRGLRGIVIREIAKAAGINLGSFVYHFKTREQFVEELVTHWYAPLYAQLEVAIEDSATETALERLRNTLHKLIELVSEHSNFICQLVFDAFAGEPAAQKFMLQFPGLHPQLLIKLTREAQAEGALVVENPVEMMQFVMGSAWYPMLLADGLMRGAEWLPPESETLRRLMTDKKSAWKRLDWALQGLKIQE